MESWNPKGSSLDDYLEYNRLLQGVVHITGNIDEYGLVNVLDDLREIVALGIDEVHIIINSGGGEMYSALAIYDALKDLCAHGVTVNARVMGMAGSAAAQIILQAADQRTASPNSRFILHEVSRGMFGMEKTSDSADSVAEMKALQQQMVVIMATRSENKGTNSTS